MRIVISILGGIGDVILLTPIFRAIKTEYQDCEITVLTTTVGKEILAGIATVDNCYVFKKNKGFFKLIYKLWRYDYAFFIDLARRPVVISYLASIKNRIGVGHKRGKYLTRILDNEKTDLYEPYNKVAIFAASDLKIDFMNRDLTQLEIGRPKDEDCLFIKKLLDENNFGEKKFIVLAPFSSWKEKDWQLKNYIDLAEKLTELGEKVIIIGVNSKENEVENKFDFINCLNLVGKTSVSQLMAIIERAKMVVTSCSGQLHIAAALNIFCVAIYGPTDSRRWAPKHKCKVLKMNLPCIPCDSKGDLANCMDKKCYKEISVDYVLQEILSVAKEIKNESIL